MPQCQVIGCKSGASSDKGGKWPVRKFPKTEEMKQKWLEAIMRPDFCPKSHDVICSKHFKEADFYPLNFTDAQGRVRKTRKLKETAVPSQFIEDFNEIYSQRPIDRRQRVSAYQLSEARKQLEASSTQQEVEPPENNLSVVKVSYPESLSTPIRIPTNTIPVRILPKVNPTITLANPKVKNMEVDKQKKLLVQQAQVNLQKSEVKYYKTFKISNTPNLSTSNRGNLLLNIPKEKVPIIIQKPQIKLEHSETSQRSEEEADPLASVIVNQESSDPLAVTEVTFNESQDSKNNPECQNCIKYRAEISLLKAQLNLERKRQKKMDKVVVSKVRKIPVSIVNDIEHGPLTEVAVKEEPWDPLAQDEPMNA